jgi:hypothetical protein
VPNQVRWRGQAPHGSLLHPVWETSNNKGEPADEAFVARCLLGAGWVGASRRLSMLDLRIWAALCGLLREQMPSAPEDDPALDRASNRTVATTGYQLADMVYGEDGGKNYRLIWRSLIRLRATTVVVHIIEQDPELAARRAATGYLGLIGDVWDARTELNLRSPREWGALNGTSSLKVEVGHWTAQQVVAGRCTWLDLDLLRALGTGLAARLWAALEAWGRWPQRSLDGREETAIGLGRPALESLGVGKYSQQRQARMALNRAGQQLVAVDPAYELVRCEQRTGGWCLVVRRVCGARGRTAARKSAAFRDPGVAAKAQQRKARQKVRAAIRESLLEAQPESRISQAVQVRGAPQGYPVNRRIKALDDRRFPCPTD